MPARRFTLPLLLRFQIDEDKFRFRPRVQVLSQLDGKARVKADFLTKLAKFWELQGSPLRHVPTVAGNNVDLCVALDIDAVRNRFPWHMAYSLAAFDSLCLDAFSLGCTTYECTHSCAGEVRGV